MKADKIEWTNNIYPHEKNMYSYKVLGGK